MFRTLCKTADTNSVLSLSYLVPAHLDRVLADYGQHMWATDCAQGDLAETLKLIMA